MTDILAWFLIEGSMVSAFAVLEDIFKPRNFAGLISGASGSEMIRWFRAAAEIRVH